MLTVLFAVALLIAFGSLFTMIDGAHASARDLNGCLHAEYRMSAVQLRNI